MESAADNNSEIQKRRSARIAQAVPLTVSGVDALGRPFEERTSTLIINCHGCRYQSKHYVLKNMWVTLEVPHPEPGCQPRVERARVMWIQRPRTVRELFQVGVELETPGNLWGIAFPPHDWFAPPQPTAAEIPGPVTGATGGEPAPQEWSTLLEPAPTEDNLRTMPMGSGVSSSLSRQMARLVNEAKQQLQAAIQASAAQAAVSETQPLLEALHKEVQESADRSVNAAAERAVGQALQEALAQAGRAGEAQLESLRERWNRELDEIVAHASQRVSQRFDEIALERGGAFEHQLESRFQHALENAERAADSFTAKLARAQENLDRFDRQAGDSAAAMLQEVEQRIQAKADHARGQLAELDEATRELNERLSSAVAAAQSGWQARLDADLAAASDRWNSQVATSFESAAQQAAERLTQHSRDITLQFEQEMASGTAAMETTLAAARAVTEGNSEAIRASLAGETVHAQDILRQVQSASQNMEKWSARVAELGKTAQQELERRAASLVEAESRQLASRAEEAIAAWTQRLEPALELAGGQTIARLGADFERRLHPHLERAGQLLQDLEGETHATLSTLRSHQESLAKASEREVGSLLARLQESIGCFEQEFTESGRVATANWLAEIDGKATETTHTVFESLFKTADWYEKKVQNQMQAVLEKGLEQAGSGLREKAGEISRLFATELDHYSRSYVEHTQGQCEESVRDALERVSKQSAELAAASEAALGRRAHQQTEAALGELQGKTGAALEQFAAQIQERCAQVQKAMEADSQQFSTQFRATLAHATEQAMGNARQELASHAEQAKDNLSRGAETLERQLRQEILSLSDESVGQYKQRLENASNSWLVTTGAKLSQQSEEQIESIARAMELRLRDACNRVFTGAGEALRSRMLDLFSLPAGTEFSELK